MSASGSSVQHPSLYGPTKTQNSPHLSPLPPSSSSSSSTFSYSPLRKLQQLTATISSRPLPARLEKGAGGQTERGVDWGWEGRDEDEESHQGKAIGGGDDPSRENSRIGTDSPAHKHSMARLASRDQSDSSDSGPPSPAFSLNSNSPFANGLFHFESSLFEDDDVNQGSGEDDAGDLLDESHEVKEHRERQGHHADPSVPGPAAAAQLPAHVVAEGGQVLRCHGPLQRGVLVQQGRAGLHGQEGGEDGVQGDVRDGAGIPGHGEQLLHGGLGGEAEATGTHGLQNHGPFSVSLCRQLNCELVSFFLLPLIRPARTPGLFWSISSSACLCFPFDDKT